MLHNNNIKYPEGGTHIPTYKLYMNMDVGNERNGTYLHQVQVNSIYCF